MTTAPTEPPHRKKIGDSPPLTDRFGIVVPSALPLPDTRAGAIHFFDGSARSAGEIDIRLALEVDKGTEELKVLLEKAEKYRWRWRSTKAPRS